MPLPTWVIPGVAIQQGAAGVPRTQAFILVVEDRCAFALDINGHPSAEPFEIPLSAFLSRDWIPHRWIERVEAIQPPYRLRAVYRNGIVWEARENEIIPAWPLIGREPGIVDDVNLIVRRPAVGEAPMLTYSVMRVYPRTNLVRLRQAFDSLTIDVPFETLATDYAPYPLPMPGEHWTPYGTLHRYEVLSISGRADRGGEFVTWHSHRGPESQPLPAFVLAHDRSHERMSHLPVWVRVGTLIRSLRTNETQRISALDPVLGVVETMSGPIFRDDLLNEWYPGLVATPPPRRARAEPQHVGSYWGFVNPPALVRILQVNSYREDVPFEHTDFTVGVVGSTHVEGMRGDDLRMRATLQTNMIQCPLDDLEGWVVGELRQMDDGRYFFVSEILDGDGTVALVSDFHLGEEDLDMVARSRVIAPPAETLNVWTERNRRARAVPDPTTTSSQDVPTDGFFAWVEPPCLVQVVGGSPVTVDVRLVPLGRVERIPRAVFDRQTIELAYRNIIETYTSSAEIGTLLDVASATVAVGEPTSDGRFVVYSSAALEGEDGARYSQALSVRPLPSTLGYPVAQAETLRDLLDSIMGPVALPPETPPPEVPDTQPSPSVEVRVGQRWTFEGTTYSVRRIGRDHRVAWAAEVNTLGDVVGRLRAISFETLNAQGRCLDEAPPMTVGTGQAPAPSGPKLDEWRHVATSRLCEVLDYDEKGRKAQIRWITPGGPLAEETVDVAALVEDFRAMTSEARARALSIHNAKGRPAWARLRD